MLIALALQVAAQTAAEFRPWGHFSRSPALARTSHLVEFATEYPDTPTGRVEYTLRLTHHDAQGERHVMWASSRSCGAVREAVEGLRDAPLPRPTPPDGDLLITADGIGYEFKVPVSYRGELGDTFTFRSNIGTPLARWIDAQFLVLQPCWSRDPRAAPARKP